MLKLLGGFGRFAGWFIVSVLVVVALLAITHNLPARIASARAEAANVARVSGDLAAQESAFVARAGAQVRAADAELDIVRRAGPAQLAALESRLQARRLAAADQVLTAPELGLAAVRGRSDLIIASYRARYLDLPLADRALQLIAVRRANLERLGRHQARLASIGTMIASYNRAATIQRQRIVRLGQLRQAAEAQLRNPLCRRVALPRVCDTVREIRDLEAAISRDGPPLRGLRTRIEAQRNAARAFQLAGETTRDGAQLVAAAAEAFRAEVSDRRTRAGEYVLNNAKAALRDHLGTALAIVLCAAAAPVLFKLFVFVFVAPLAARSRPIFIASKTPGLEAAAAPEPGPRAISAKSVDVPLSRDTELFVRAGVQSVSADVTATDIGLLSRHMPFTCLAAGLVNLQRMRTSGSDRIAVTALGDDHHEVAIVEVPAGEALVLHPRALVGLLKRRNDALRITRPWRIAYLAAWLTLQLRYVVFHGPCSLIVQGRHGVKQEFAGRPRMINKRLTLGFDASLAYGAARTETFLPYLVGRASLFNDRFSGGGRFLYEERPSGRRGGGIWGRGFKGLGDAVLKVFGI